MKRDMRRDIHPTLAADKWGYARALSLRLDHQFQALQEEPMGLPNVDGDGFKFHMAIGALGIVKPFDWMKWGEPHITTDAVPTLDDDSAWRHVTRIVRSERFCEGTFDACVRDGSLTALIRHLYLLRCTENGRPLGFPMFNDGTVEPGIRLAGIFAGTYGYTTGRTNLCDEDGCGRWSIEVQSTEAERKWYCSMLWHYVQATDEMYTLRRAKHSVI